MAGGPGTALLTLGRSLKKEPGAWAGPWQTSGCGSSAEKGKGLGRSRDTLGTWALNSEPASITSGHVAQFPHL